MKCIRQEIRLQNISDYIDNYGYWKFPFKTFAENHKVSVSTTKKDYEEVLRIRGIEDVQKIELALFDMFNDAFKRVRYIMLNSEDTKEILMAVEQLRKMVETHIKMLESFGRKEKVNDVVETRSININMDIDELRKIYTQWQKQWNEA